MDLSTFLRDLGPTQALRLSAIAFVLGFVAIVIDWGSILAWVFLPSVPIAAYTWALWVSQATYFVSHSPGTKTSPYILGFLLTLSALFILFLRGGDNLVSGDIDINMLLGQVGAAIMTTAVGLAARQILIATDSAEEQAAASVSVSGWRVAAKRNRIRLRPAEASVTDSGVRRR